MSLCWSSVLLLPFQGQLFFRHSRSFDTRSNLVEGDLSRRRLIVVERGESTIVRRSQLFDRNEFRRLENPFTHFFGCLHLWHNRIDHTDKDAMPGLHVVPDTRQDLRTIRFTGQLQVEVTDVQLKERRKNLEIINAVRMTTILITA